MSPRQHYIKDWAAIIAAVLALLGTAWQSSKGVEGRLSALEQSRADTADEVHQIHLELQELRQWALGHK